MPSTPLVHPKKYDNRHLHGSFAALGATRWSLERTRPSALPELLLPVRPVAPEPPAPSFSVRGLHDSSLPARRNGKMDGALNPGPLLCGLAGLGLLYLGIGGTLRDGSLLAGRLLVSQLMVGGTEGGGTWAPQPLITLPDVEAVARSVLAGLARVFGSEAAACLGAALRSAMGVVAHVAAMLGGACVARALAERCGRQEAGWH